MTIDFFPMRVEQVSLAFGPPNVADYYPPPSVTVSKDAYEMGRKAFSAMFFKGGKIEFVAREPVDGNKALRHIRVIAASFEPKHEVKEKVCATLFGYWFERVEVKQ